jgi:HPt (histidine-containing phosphotransfer) domain-containing protein
MDGMEATAILRGMGYNEPIVALTANALAGQADRFLQNGFDEFMPKPIDIRQLNSVLNKLVRDKQPPSVIEAAMKAAQSKKLEDAVPFVSGMVTALYNVYGLDVDGALKATGGMQDVYEKSVKLTARLMPETIEKMDRHLADANVKGFTIEVHGIKSVLRNIGAFALGNWAAQLEAAAIEGDMSLCASNYPPFKKSLISLLQQVNAVIASEPEAEKEDFNKEAFLEALRVAKAAAGGYDAMTAAEALGPLRNFNLDKNMGEALEKAVFALEEFNCTDAVVRIESMESMLR